MNHKNWLCSLVGLGLVAAIAYAEPPLSKPQLQPKPAAQTEESETAAQQGVTEPQPVANFTKVFTTSFEAADGWVLGSQLCGPEFSATCVQGGSQGTTCSPKNHAVSRNCCQADPNEDTGWWLNISSNHCNQPHISSVHPKTGPLHLRQSQELLLPAGACTGTGMGAGCRHRFTTPVDRSPGGQELGSKDVYSFEIAFSKVIGNKRIRQLIGWDTAGTNLGTFGYNIPGLAGLYFNFDGNINVCLSVACPLGAAGQQFLAYWKYDVPEYGKLTYTVDRCNNTVAYTYQNSPTNALCPSCISTFTVTNAGFNIFSPPYGNDNTDVYAVLLDLNQFQINNIEDTMVDLDDVVIAHTPCPDACCNRLGDGACEEGLTETACEVTGGRYFPNVQCAQLGTEGFPPACTGTLGSCCNSGPGAGGACTDGVLQSACSGPQRTWTEGATCDQDGFQTLCNFGAGSCSSDAGLGPHASYCFNLPGRVPCTSAADCEVPGFCFGGHCTASGPPGTCQYTSPASAGYCAAMGSCVSTGVTCNPDTGAGCCDYGCTPAVTCAAGPADCQNRASCDAVPSGADCAFCEPCNAWPLSSGACTTTADCPPIIVDGVPVPGTCVANPTFVCNTDADCPVGETCGIPALSPASYGVCTDDADCFVPAAPPCEETLGACCEAVKGTCDDDVLAADCVSGTAEQLTWSKGLTCAEVETAGNCDADLGACCDRDTFGGCVDTTFNGCVASAANPKLVWTKNVLCADVTDCTHKAIPTVSEWGIVVLTLLLLVGAKVYFGRRQASAA